MENRFNKFKELLRAQDLQVLCNWQAKTGSILIEQWVVQGSKGLATFIAVIYGGSNGFNLYLESDKNNMLTDVEQLLKKVGG